MAWKLRAPDGSWHSTEDFLFVELEAVERTTEIPWSMQNPFRSINSFRALMATVAARVGLDDADTTEWLNSMTARTMSESIELAVAEDERPEVYKDGLPLVEAESSTGTSATSPSDAVGPPR